MNQKKVILTAGILSAASIGILVLLASRSEDAARTPVVVSEKPEKESVTVEETETVLVDPVNESVIPEIRYLPDEIALGSDEKVSNLNLQNFNRGTKSLRNIRAIVASDDLGGYINPKLSPDGLQVMMTRPGFQGIYVVPSAGKEAKPSLVVDLNAWTAKWTADGKIYVEVNGDEVRLYNVDGSLEFSEEKVSGDELAYSRDDVIYVAGASGESAVPLTDNSDRYIAPLLSPGEDHVAFIGLHTGLYVSPVDGSSEPAFLGEGYNVSWAPDGNSMVFNRPVDDGHYVVESDIYHYDLGTGTLTNLTEDTDLVGQYPDVGPDGSTVTFESEGSIYSGIID